MNAKDWCNIIDTELKGRHLRLLLVLDDDSNPDTRFVKVITHFCEILMEQRIYIPPMNHSLSDNYHGEEIEFDTLSDFIQHPPVEFLIKQVEKRMLIEVGEEWEKYY